MKIKLETLVHAIKKIAYFQNFKPRSFCWLTNAHFIALHHSIQH